MTTRIRQVDKDDSKTVSLLRLLGTGIILLGLLIACSICFFSSLPVSIENPALLVLGGLALLIPFRRNSFRILQQISGFYLIAVIINELALQFVELPFVPAQVTVSKAACILMIFAVGFFVDRITSTRADLADEKGAVFYGWLFAISLLIVHMVFLAVMLRKFYGYGYGRDWNVLGNLFLYFVLFVLLWEKLGEIRLRQCIGLLFVAFFLLNI